MASKRVLVPAALHAELTEYTNLIRVLRTSRALDLTTHLLDHASQQRRQDQENEVEGKGKSRTRDTWTPWPLLDFPLPEWRFDEEIELLGETVVRQISKLDVKGNTTNPETDSGDGDDGIQDIELDPLEPQTTRLLVEQMGAFLIHILNLMADHRPSTSGSMQNRLWAINWEDVISILAVHGAVDSKVISRTEKRLQRIYGPSDNKAIERMHAATSAKLKFQQTVSPHDDLLFEAPIHRPQKRQKKRERRIVSKAIIDSASDDD